MIEKKVLRELILRAVEAEPGIGFGQNLFSRIEQLATKLDAWPKDYYPVSDPNARRYALESAPQLHDEDYTAISEIVWDLIVERILTHGMNRNNLEWPWLRLTDHGKAVLSGANSGFYDPDEYVNLLVTMAPSVDDVVKQYALESVRAFRQNLLFASAVMIGAASEKSILLLLASIGNAHSNAKTKKIIVDLLDRPRLPTIFDTINDVLQQLVASGTIPYSVHQGSSQHLLSAAEMIRMQRNDAVHPAAGQVNKDKVFLSIQTFPAMLGATYHLIDWFSVNTI